MLKGFKNKLIGINPKESRIVNSLTIFRTKCNAFLKENGIADEKEQTEITVEIFKRIVDLYTNVPKGNIEINDDAPYIEMAAILSKHRITDQEIQENILCEFIKNYCEIKG